MSKNAIFLITLFAVLLNPFFGFTHDAAHSSNGTNPLFEFQENKGQFAPSVLYKAQLPGGALFLENNQWTYHFYDAGLISDLHVGNYSGDLENLKMQHHAYRVSFLNSHPQPTIEAKNDQPHFYNYFKGKNPQKWASQVKAYTQINYHSLYKNIDAHLYNWQGGLKYDWIVHPGADPTDIKWKIEGANAVSIKRGKLVIATSLGEQWEEKPYAYQIIDGQEVEVDCEFVLQNGQLSFKIDDSYRKDLKLIIDPVLVFSTYSGSVSANFGYTATSDALGYLYAGSTSFGVDYPTTLGAFQTTWAGGDGFNGGPNFEGTDVAITKYDTSGTFMIYSTYLGGQNDDLPHSLVVNENNELYVMGTTGSVDFPTSSNAYDDMLAVNQSNSVSLLGGLGANFINSCDVFVTKFNASGTGIIGSTFLGGTNVDGLNLANALKVNYADEIRGEVEIDQLGNVYVVSSTRSADFPIHGNVFQPNKAGTGNDQDGFIAKLTPDLDQVIWSSFIGGNSPDAVYSISIDSQNNLYISGGTLSNNFPVTSNAYNSLLNGNVDAFVTQVASNGSAILNSTYFGSGPYDQSYFVELDNRDKVYIFGQTEASGNSLVINANYSVPNSGQFITKFTPQLDSVIWSTVFGSGDGDPDISPTAFMVDLCSAVYLSGWGSSIQSGNLSTSGLPVTPGALQNTTDDNDFYLMVLADDASQLNYASYFGGSAQEHVDGGTSRFDKKGKIYQSVCAGCPAAGQPASSDFPTFPNPGAVSNVNGAEAINSCNAASFKIDFNLPVVLADFLAPEAGCAPTTVTFDNISLQQNHTTFQWDFGDGNSSTLFEPTHTYTQAGTYTISLIVSDTASCNLNDTLTKQISILADSSSTLPFAVTCPGIGSPIGTINNPNPNVDYTWIPSSYLSDTTIANPVATPPISMQYTLLIDNGVCTDTLVQDVFIDSLDLSPFADTVICTSEGPVQLAATNNGGGFEYVWSTNNQFTDQLNTSLQDSLATVMPTDSITWYYIEATSVNGCVYQDSIRIRVQDLQDPLAANFDAPATACAPTTVNFNNTTTALTNTNYIWQLPDGTTTSTTHASFQFTQSGNYTVDLIAIDTAICNQFDTLSLSILVDTDSNYTVNAFACSNQDAVVGVAPDTLPGTIYQWFPANLVSDASAPNPTVNLANDTTLLLVVNNGVCTDSITQEVTVEPIEAFTQNTFITCTSDLPLVFSGSSVGTAQRFIWSTQSPLADTLNTSVTDSTFTLSQANQAVSTFWFSAESANGCLLSEPLEVIFSDLTLQAEDTTICSGNEVEITAQNGFPQNSLSYNWTPEPSITTSLNQATISVNPAVTTIYQVEAINDSGCVATANATVTVTGLDTASINAYATQDTVYGDLSTELVAEPQLINANYQWTPIEGLAQPNQAITTAYPQETTTYSVLITDQASGCSYAERVRVYRFEINCGEPNIFIPTAFTPNGDGENDQLFVRGKNIDEMSFFIYNSWGEKVFESNNQQTGWDGTHRGTQANNEVFVYYLEATCVDGQRYFKKGDVTVIR